MPPSHAPLMFFSLPLAIVFGIITIICLFVTALLGYLVLKGRVPFVWHKRMAFLTITFAVAHVVLVIGWLTGKF